MSKLKIWGLSDEDSAVFLYRVNQPLRGIAQQNLAKVHTLPIFGQHVNHLTGYEFKEYYEKESQWADVLMTTCPKQREYLSLILGCKEYGKLKLIVDVDDDVLAVHTEPNNPAYKAFMDKDARYAEYAQVAMREADLLVCSTEYLYNKYASLNPNRVVVNNCTDEKFFNYENKPDDVTIGFAGAGGHQGDWKMIESVLKKLKEKYKFKVKMIGPMQSDVIDEQIKWVDMFKYPKTLVDMGFSIGVAPLKDSLMNRAKSNLKWLEYSTYEIPTVASDVVSYRGIDNILYATEPDEWYSQLEKLILDKELRTNLGRNAKIEMKTKYDLKEQSKILFEKISTMRR